MRCDSARNEPDTLMAAESAICACAVAARWAEPPGSHPQHHAPTLVGTGNDGLITTGHGSSAFYAIRGERMFPEMQRIVMTMSNQPLRQINAMPARSSEDPHAANRQSLDADQDNPVRVPRPVKALGQIPPMAERVIPLVDQRHADPVAQVPLHLLQQLVCWWTPGGAPA